MAFPGPNGAGKTTFVEALAGLLAIDHGAIMLDGALLDDWDATFAPPNERAIGMVFQDALLFRHMDVLGNVAFPLCARVEATGEAPSPQPERVRTGTG